MSHDTLHDSSHDGSHDGSHDKSHDGSSSRRLRPTRALHRASAPEATHAGRHWVVGPRADLDGFLCQVAAICEATGPGGGPPDILWLREIAKVYGLVPAEMEGRGDR